MRTFTKTAFAIIILLATLLLTSGCAVKSMRGPRRAPPDLNHSSQTDLMGWKHDLVEAIEHKQRIYISPAQLQALHWNAMKARYDIDDDIEVSELVALGTYSDNGMWPHTKSEMMYSLDVLYPEKLTRIDEGYWMLYTVEKIFDSFDYMFVEMDEVQEPRYATHREDGRVAWDREVNEPSMVEQRRGYRVPFAHKSHLYSFRQRYAVYCPDYPNPPGFYSLELETKRGPTRYFWPERRKIRDKLAELKKRGGLTLEEGQTAIKWLRNLVSSI
ncbi:MAG: hypothetical protein ABIE94_00290 [archaeon]